VIQTRCSCFACTYIYLLYMQKLYTCTCTYIKKKKTYTYASGCTRCLVWPSTTPCLDLLVLYKKEKNIYLCVWVYEMPCLAKYHSLSRSTSAIHAMELLKVRCASVTMHARFVSSSVSRILVVCMYEEEDTCQVI